MNIAQAPAQYDKTDQDRMRGEIASADAANLKTGQILSKLLFRDTVTGAMVTVVVTAGAFVIT